MKLPIKSIKEFGKCTLSTEEIVNIISTKIGEVERLQIFQKSMKVLLLLKLQKKKIILMQIN
jgi:hypothetical protein